MFHFYNPWKHHRDSTKAIEVFLQQKNRKKTYVEQKRSWDQSTNEDSK